MDTSDLPLDFELMRGKATEASDFLKTLANPDRLLLEATVGVKQPTLSQQLTILRSEKLVNTRRDGKQIYYSVASQKALNVLQLLYEQFCKKN